MTRATRRKRMSPIIGVGIAAGALLLLAAAILILGGKSPGRVAIEVNGQPRLRVDREIVDLGDIQLGRTVEAVFVLTNVGDQPLRLTDAPYVEVVEGC